MKTCQKNGQTGFTLAELMIGIAILAILMGVAVPSFQEWMLTTQVRTAAESIQNGLQRARSEAVARNANVAFTLGTGSSWTVSCITACGSDPVGTILDSRSSNEGSSRVTSTVFPLTASIITFNNFGGVVANVPASLTLAQVNLAAAGSMQPFRVTIGIGGITRLCDPNLIPGSNPRAC